MSDMSVDNVCKDCTIKCGNNSIEICDGSDIFDFPYQQLKYTVGGWVIEPTKIRFEPTEVKIITNDEDVAIGVKITFDNGSTQKAICSEDDVFNLEYGITICLFKELLKLMGSHNESRDYNNAVRDVLKQCEKQELAQLEEEAKKAQIEYRRAKRAEKKKRRAERKAAAERERQIEIQKEAYLRAMQEYDRQKIDRMTDDLK